MFAEYSYFRAEGASLTAIKTIADARQEMTLLEKALCNRFGATKVAGALDPETGRYSVQFFQFDAPKKPPEKWVDVFSHGKYLLPPAGSPEKFYIANMEGLMERAAKRLGLEEVLKAGEMPMREMEQGASVSSLFVRYSMAPKPGDKPAGSQTVAGSGGFSVLSGPWKAADPLVFMEMQGSYYIRVPNRPGTEAPVFAPPQAVPVGYDDMLAIDKREQAEKFNRLRSTTFEGYCC